MRCIDPSLSVSSSRRKATSYFTKTLAGSLQERLRKKHSRPRSRICLQKGLKGLKQTRRQVRIQKTSPHRFRHTPSDRSCRFIDVSTFVPDCVGNAIPGGILRSQPAGDRSSGRCDTGKIASGVWCTSQGGSVRHDSHWMQRMPLY